MTNSVKKEIAKLVAEALKELGHVDHRVQGAGPWYGGFPELPVSGIQNEYLDAKVEEAYDLIERALDTLDEVVSQMESTGHYPGNILLITDQVELVADSLADHLGIDTHSAEEDEWDEDEEEDLDEAKRKKKRRKCRCADGRKKVRCCRKRRRRPRHFYWFGYGWPRRKFYGGHHHHHHHHGGHPPPPPPTPPADPGGSSGGSGGSEGSGESDGSGESTT